MKSLVYIEGPDNDKFSEFLSVPFINIHNEEKGIADCNLFVFIFKSKSTREITEDSPEWLAEIVAQVTYLTCKMPKSTFIICEDDDGIVSETVWELWKSTGVNMFASTHAKDLFEEVAKKINNYSKFLDKVLIERSDK